MRRELIAFLAMLIVNSFVIDAMCDEIDATNTTYGTNDVFVCGRVIEYTPSGYFRPMEHTRRDVIVVDLIVPERWFNRQIRFSEHYTKEGPWRKVRADLSFWISSSLLEEHWDGKLPYFPLRTVSLIKEASCGRHEEGLNKTNVVSVPSVINPVEHIQEVRKTNETGDAFWFLGDGLEGSPIPNDQALKVLESEEADYGSVAEAAWTLAISSNAWPAERLLKLARDPQTPPLRRRACLVAVAEQHLVGEPIGRLGQFETFRTWTSHGQVFETSRDHSAFQQSYKFDYEGKFAIALDPGLRGGDLYFFFSVPVSAEEFRRFVDEGPREGQPVIEFINYTYEAGLHLDVP